MRQHRACGDDLSSSCPPSPSDRLLFAGTRKRTPGDPGRLLSSMSAKSSISDMRGRREYNASSGTAELLRWSRSRIRRASDNMISCNLAMCTDLRCLLALFFSSFLRWFLENNSSISVVACSGAGGSILLSWIRLFRIQVDGGWG